MSFIGIAGFITLLTIGLINNFGVVMQRANGAKNHKRLEKNVSKTS